MDTVGVLTSLTLLFIACLGGLAARLAADFIEHATLLQGFRNWACGYKGPPGSKVVVDRDKEDSLLCELLSCDFCLQGWAALVFSYLQLSRLEMSLWWLVILWPATWRVAYSLPD